ncbi:MAG: hypothetical protein IPM91_11335 [Bacteroidetes bacterium]|nr:hypothetical protein [Bacteroidota bacterium]
MMFLIVSNYVIAQKSDSSLIDKKYFNSFFKDSRDLVLSPGKIKREDWNFTGAPFWQFLPGLCSMNRSKNFSGDKKFAAEMKNG